MIVKQKVKKIFVILGLVILGLIIIWRVLFIFKFNQPVTYGVTFSQKQAEELNLDWRETYLAILNDLQVKNLRLVAYWDLIEKSPGVYDFSNLDWQMREASSHQAKVILVVGRRVPRWPECHAPNWLGDLTSTQQETAQLNYLQNIVTRYQNQPALEIWQVENEPFLEIFGLCPLRNKPLLIKELALVKNLDPTHPTMVTDSGELATWLRTRGLADYLGTSVYIIAKTFWGYIDYGRVIPPVYYRIKAFLIHKPIDKIIVSELQAEPWTQQMLVNTPLDIQDRTMGLERFQTNIKLAQKLGFERVYLWGAEWWYWRKLQGDPSFWNHAKGLF